MFKIYEKKYPNSLSDNIFFVFSSTYSPYRIFSVDNNNDTEKEFLLIFSFVRIFFFQLCITISLFPEVEIPIH